MRQRGFVFLPVIIIIVLLGVVGTLAYQNSQLRMSGGNLTSPPSLPTIAITSNLPKSSLISNSIANWKTYLNQEYKFSINYPEGVEQGEIKVNNNVDTEKGTIFLVGFSFSGPTQNEGTGWHDGFGFTIRIIENQNTKLPLDFAQDAYKSAKEGIESFPSGQQDVGDIKNCKVEETQINGVKGARFTNCFCIGDCVLYSFDEWYIYNGKTIKLSCFLANEPYRKSFNQMYSTFKFIQ